MNLTNVDIDKYFSKLDNAFNKMALEKRLEIEAEHLKRIKTTKIIRFYTVKENKVLKVYAKVFNNLTGELKEDTIDFWELVKRVVIVDENAIIGDNTNTTNNNINNDNNSVTDDNKKIKKDNNITNINISNDNNINTSNNTITNISNNVKIYEWTEESNAYAFLVENASDSLKMYVKLKNTLGYFKLNRELQELFDLYADSRPNVVKEFYKYVTLNKLLNHTTGEVTCDEKLKNIFKKEYFDFNDIDEMIEDKLEIIDYCTIEISNNNLNTNDNINNLNLNTNDNINNLNSDNNINNDKKIKMFDIEVDCDDITQMPILFENEVKMMNKKIEGNKMLEKKLLSTISLLEDLAEDPIQMISKYLILEKNIMGIKTVYFEDLNVQSALFELLMGKKE
ncbi:snf12-1 [Ecytonucleospora hepatopenaei]|uniref:Snf12-1 n=1 Tax=Ecytonucleospora hepatopenaei TaxID=646526 RepID=A0A1W0E4B9_9MICR|nr:snf12-1 [Ecytonucleospora hepatopenaei]